MSVREERSGRKVLLGEDRNALVVLFAVNMLIFVTIMFLKTVYYITGTPLEFFYKQVINWFVLPASAETLATRPWTVFIYMFTHVGFMQLLGNMLWLWCFGYILQDLAGNNKLIPIYLYGGFASALVFVLMNNLFPGLERNISATAPLSGAAAAVLAVAVATTTLAPEYRLLAMLNGGIPLWVITILFVAFDFASLAQGNIGATTGSVVAGGIGFFYVRQLREGKDWGAWMVHLMEWINNLFNPEKKQASGRKRIFYQSDRPPFVKKTNLSQQKLDEILDKINQTGYQSLSEEEKAFLNRASSEEL